MADTLLSFGVQKLWDLLVRESERFRGVDEQLTELKRDINLLRSFLKDADAKKHASAVVRNCVEEIKEIVFDTEDIIETFLLKEKLSKTSGIKKRMRRLSCIIVERMELASDMRGISKRISKVIRDMQSFGVQQIIVIDGGECSHPLQERQREMRKTFPSNNENDLVGLEENVKKLVDYLVEEDSIQLVSITGMGGLGKTTLARQVFNHEDVKRKFDGLAWVCVSQDFTRMNVWQKILGDLKPKEEENKILGMTESTLQSELIRLLETTKSLIVLDDIWKEEDWDLIKPIFPPKKGWKVLLTSRNESVALRRNTTYINFKPECLTKEDSWTLFQRIALPINEASDVKIDGEMEEMGKQMIKHCGGLPLAIKVLGGMLAAKYTLHYWKRVSENIGSHLMGGTTYFNDDKSSSFNHVLSLSFEELPSYLKRCFLYLAHFPEDHKINVENLSYYWAADGIFEPRHYDGETIQDVGNSYIEELVARNMVISERDVTNLRYETCHLHDMMREICLFKAKEENFLQIASAHPSAANFQSPRTSRRFVSRDPTTLDIERDINNPKLRSLVVIVVEDVFEEGWKLSSTSFKRLELLRVLDLFGAEFKGRKLPSSIGKLIHLRYLSLRKAEVSHLPSSMRNLKLLLYLNLAVRSPLYIPNNVLNEMRELTYLSLPWVIDDNVKTMELGNLVNLETLENFSTKHSSVRVLQRMKRLETLSIKFNGGCTMETLSSSLSELSRLENLRIRDYEFKFNDEKERFVLDCVHLKNLELFRIFMPRLPDEQHFPSHLTSIYLVGCRLEEDPMPILEKLLQLKHVALWSESFKRMVCSSGGFSQLQKLEFSGLKEWEEWIVEEGSMPLLRTLHIEDCEKLKELPDGLRFITSLKELKIFAAPLELKEKLSRGGEDYYKVQHIPLVRIQNWSIGPF